MPGTSLSRWTLTGFAAALAFLLAGLLLGVAGPDLPGQWLAGGALAVIHLFALGWLSMAMLAALLQFAPVLAARPLARPELAAPMLGLLGLGTLLLAAGFPAPDSLAGAVLPLGAALVLGALLLALRMLLPVLIPAGGWRGAEARLVLLALAGLVLVWASGMAMALALGGIAPTPGTALMLRGLPLHVVLGAGGWLSLAAFGVSYKLFAMFLLAPEQDSRLRRLGAGGAALALALTVTALILLPSGAALLLVPAAAGLAALLYLADIRRLWRQRRRPPEVNMRLSLVALGFLAAGVLLLIPAFAHGGAAAEAAGFVLLAGWLSTLTLAQMVKITAFLTWMQMLAPRIGRGPVPMVQDLGDARATGRWLGLWSGATGLGTLALCLAAPGLFRLAAGLMLLALLGLGRELWHIRRLTHIAGALRPARLPPLFLPPIPDRGSPHAAARSADA